jgi:hypothetical protein
MLILRKRVIDLDASADFCISTGEKTQGGEKRMSRLGKEEEDWLYDAMQEINRLTPDIKEKAFSPDWFLLRQRFEQKLEQFSAIRAELKQAQCANQELRDLNVAGKKLGDWIDLTSKLAAAESRAGQETDMESWEEKNADTPLKITVEDGCLVIRIGVNVIAFAAEEMEVNNPFDETLDDFKRLWSITDPEQFTKDLIREIEREEEDGTTPLALFLDKMCLNAIEDGTEAVKELE